MRNGIIKGIKDFLLRLNVNIFVWAIVIFTNDIMIDYFTDILHYVPRRDIAMGIAIKLLGIILSVVLFICSVPKFPRIKIISIALYAIMAYRSLSYHPYRMVYWAVLASVFLIAVQLHLEYIMQLNKKRLFYLTTYTLSFFLYPLGIFMWYLRLKEENTRFIYWLKLLFISMVITTAIIAAAYAGLCLIEQQMSKHHSVKP